MTSELPSNPFHLEAVATYGQVLRTCRDLDYMQNPLEQLNLYLSHYFPLQARYGGTIGLRGGHGSGKTHLLNWLAQEARERERIKPVVVYAKADHANFFDLYLQFMEMLPREEIQELINEGLKKTAKAEVYKAAATEPLADRIDAPDGLAQLAEEGNLDLNQLLILMNEKLGALIPSEIPRILLMVNSPRQGKKAYQWLMGKDVENVEALGVRSLLLQPNQNNEDSSAPDVIAINALEAIAALLHLAERPFIVLIDQLEVLFQVDTTRMTSSELEGRDEQLDFFARKKQRQLTIFSAIKKLIEQLGRQNALMFIAGNNESWEILPRDVTPRMRLREPLPVGNLKAQETKNLLEEYTRGLPSSFSEESITHIHRLSGGSPREIIRIAYYAYEEVDGKLSEVNENVLLKSANSSGSIEDRNKLALSMAESVFRKFGDSSLKDLDIGDGILLDLLLKDRDRPIVALVTMKATDKLSEVESAKRLNTIRTYLEKTWPQSALVVVTVGYSSRLIQKLLGETSTIIQFDESTFANSLLTRVTELAAMQRSKAPSREGSDPAVLTLLEKIAERLNNLEVERSEEVKQVAERFAERTRASTAPERQQRELRTRWDLLSVVDDLQSAFLHGGRGEEQQLIKAILIANESQLKLKQIDHIGGLYLDAMSEEENLASITNSEITGREVVLRREVSNYRKDIIAELRRILRGPRGSDRLIEHPWKYSLSASAIVAALYFVWYVSIQGIYFDRSLDYLIYLSIGKVVPIFLLVAALLSLLVFYLRWLRLLRWDRDLRKIRRMSREV